jgi:hypothetical protein
MDHRFRRKGNLDCPGATGNKDTKEKAVKTNGHAQVPFPIIASLACGLRVPGFRPDAERERGGSIGENRVVQRRLDTE